MGEKIRVLYICHDLNYGGAVLSLFNMIQAVYDQVEPYVLLREKCAMVSKFEELNCECLIYRYELNIANSNPMFRFFSYPARRLRDYVVNRQCGKSVVKRLNGKKIDIVHSNSSVISFGENLAKKLGAKHVWHIREILDLGLNMKPIEGFNSFQHKLFNSDAIIAITRAVYERWEMQKCRNSYIIPDAVRSKTEVVYKQNKEKFILFCATSLSDLKGADQAAEIFCKSKLIEDGYKLYYIGEYTPDYRYKLEKIFESNKQSRGVSFLGFQSEIKKYMIAAAAYLMCSKYEGLGRVTIEAMFYGCPVLGHNAGGTKDIITHDVTGLLYDTTDEAVVMLIKLIDDKALSKRLTKCAAEVAKSRFSEEEYGKKIMDVYRQVLK